MASYWGDVWNNLVFRRSEHAGIQILQNASYRIPNSDGSTLTYKNPRYKSVLVHVAKQIAMAEISGELNRLLPRFRRHLEKEKNKEAFKWQESRRAKLIVDNKAQSKSWGIITTPEKHDIVAHDKYGTKVPEALMLYYEGEKEIQVEDVFSYDKDGNLKKVDGEDNNKNSFTTKTVCHIDLAPQISTNSTKNIVMTKVQGRDYTRKELVSGGDLTFSVNGLIVSDREGIYPESAVQKFLQIMQYNGILNVNSLSFGTLGVTRVIITDFSLGTPQCKNEQPYSFNCVAVEPDEEMQVVSDTIGAINEKFQENTDEEFYEMILDNKLAEAGANMLYNTASTVVTQGVGMGLDALVPNI